MERKALYTSVARDLADMSFLEIDLLVDALFEISDTLPYTFNRAVHCNLKKREDALRTEILSAGKTVPNVKKKAYSH